MANLLIKNPTEYVNEIEQLKTTDRAHADIFNAVFTTLINNDEFLKTVVEELQKKTEEQTTWNENITKKVEENEIKIEAVETTVAENSEKITELENANCNCPDYSSKITELEDKLNNIQISGGNGSSGTTGSSDSDDIDTTWLANKNIVVFGDHWSHYMSEFGNMNKQTYNGCSYSTTSLETIASKISKFDFANIDIIVIQTSGIPEQRVSMSNLDTGIQELFEALSNKNICNKTYIVTPPNMVDHYIATSNLSNSELKYVTLDVITSYLYNYCKYYNVTPICGYTYGKTTWEQVEAIQQDISTWLQKELTVQSDFYFLDKYISTPTFTAVKNQCYGGSAITPSKQFVTTNYDYFKGIMFFDFYLEIPANVWSQSSNARGFSAEMHNELFYVLGLPENVKYVADCYVFTEMTYCQIYPMLVFSYTRSQCFNFFFDKTNHPESSEKIAIHFHGSFNRLNPLRQLSL